MAWDDIDHAGRRKSYRLGYVIAACLATLLGVLAITADDEEPDGTGVQVQESEPAGAP